MNAVWKTLIALVLFTVANAQPGRAVEKGQDCFSLMQWRGWKAPNPETIYIKVNNSQVYEIALAEHNSFLRAPGMHLVSHSRGSDWVCSPLDLDLQLSSFPGIPEHLFVKSLRKLNAEEIAAIAPDDRP